VHTVNSKTLKIICASAVQLFAIYKLVEYGVTLAKLGIDSQVALAIGVMVGSIAGANVKWIIDILRGGRSA